MTATTKRLIASAAVIILALIIAISIVVSIFADWLWFTEVGYLFVFKKVLVSTWSLGIVATLVFFAFIFVNVTIARRLAPKYRVVFEEPALDKVRQFFAKWGRLTILGISLFISFLVGIGASKTWEKALLFLKATKFNIKEPVFNIDIGFYVFKLPFLSFVQGWIMATLVLTLIAVALIHWLEGSIRLTSRVRRIETQAKAHLSFLLGLIFVNLAWGYRIDMYNLLFSARGAAYGASYTDIHANLPILWVLLTVSLVSAALLIVNVWFKGWKLPFAGIALLVVTSVVAGGIYPAVVQQYRVKPNEISLERPYIRRNIEFTQKAYGLKKVKKFDFNVANRLTLGQVQRKKATVENIRLWDWRPLKSTYQQLQTIRPYYQFNDVDVDRYMINGQKRQVTLAARELKTQADETWLNEHLVFTHGYGVTMNPAKEITPEGLPDLIIKNLPPVSKTDVKVTRPAIYFGENPESYIIANSDEKELDYPKGDKNVYTNYKGSGGVPTDSLIKRAAFAYHFSDINILLTGAVKKGSRLMYNRNILERAKKIAPFLHLDSDPYIVIDSSGKLFWIQDAYTTTNFFPYSKPAENGYNYIRNSVKIVTDAYNGVVTLYYMGDDPIAKTYNQIFPGILTPFSKMPADLKEHIRYPQKLFEVQAQMYSTYHMEDPKVFYNKEDKWGVPAEKFYNEESGQNESTPIEPYYAILELERAKGDFLLITPFTPADKNNMISWLSANSEPENYGELLLYKFPKQELVFGPLQIEARIDQDPVISERFTLWGQVGSKVIRGNLLVIPIEKSLLYVEPIYLQSSESQIPELKRVVVAFGDRVAMEPTFEKALESVFTGQQVAEARKEQTPIETEGNLIQQAKDAYAEAVKKQKEGDWAGYGKAIEKLGRILEKLK